MKASKLFSPVDLNRRSLSNRIAMAPMTREKAVAGLPCVAALPYYARRAAGGVGLIITEGVAVDVPGSFGSTVPRLHGEGVVPAWRPIVDAVHEHGTAILAQLWHVGAFCPSLIGMTASLPEQVERVSPSGLAAPEMPFGREMTMADIDAAIAAFVSAAQTADAAGFDGVEIHAAHGYLVDQFFWEGTNRRSDRYGGSPEARLTFAIELIRAIRAATPPDFIISLRISQWKQLEYGARMVTSPAMLARMIEPLALAGTDVFHCSTRRFWEPEFEGDRRSLSGWVRALSGKPTIAVGSVTLDTDFKEPDGKVRANLSLDHIALLEQGLEAGDWDLVAIGRGLIANPDWVDLVRAGRAEELRKFSKDMLDELV
ncbi:12-oxophytodienoate reductase [Novosphingobium sp. MD-1]|uniref:oxidoreductase n=1 Tax=Novosphingobium sp. MD-1 TaxID=1630648 RepID=UPI000F7ED183|nr:12-oxophytodienoate reductase [Novosphingobium sp. MD-1]